jgi:hypothetical protein
MRSLRLNLGLAASLSAAACLGATAAHATPIITTFAQYSVGPVTDADGPVVQQPGDPQLTSSVTTTQGVSPCTNYLSCGGTPLSADANAIASQRNTVFGVFSALQADGNFYVSPANTLTARTTWQESPSAAGPNSITLFIKAGELALSDFGSINFSNATFARYRIELRLNGSLVFFSEAILQGGAGGATLTESGTDLGGTVFVDPDYPSNVRDYRFDPLATTIALGNLTPADIVTYTMEVSVGGPNFETGGFARIGDPFDLSGGGSSIAFSVPEPSLALLLGGGLLGLASWRGRTRVRVTLLGSASAASASA